MLRTAQLFSSLAGSASFLCSSFGGQFVYVRIASHSADDICSADTTAGQRSVKTVAVDAKPPFGEPLRNFLEHLLGQLDQCGTIFSMHSHVDWQSNRRAFPWRMDSQCYYHQIQSPRIYYLAGCRTNRISPPAGTIDFLACAMKDRIVYVEQNDASRAKDPHQQNRQMFPELTACPYGVGKEAVVGIVCVDTLRVGQRQDAGYGLSGRAEYPAGHKIQKNPCRGSRENGKKVLHYIRPCRSNMYGVHTSLPFQCFPTFSSEGWYVYDNSSSKLAA
jgi:hypothetical protein